MCSFNTRLYRSMSPTCSSSATSFNVHYVQTIEGTIQQGVEWCRVQNRFNSPKSNVLGTRHKEWNTIKKGHVAATMQIEDEFLQAGYTSIHSMHDSHCYGRRCPVPSWTAPLSSISDEGVTITQITTQSLTE